MQEVSNPTNHLYEMLADFSRIHHFSCAIACLSFRFYCASHPISEVTRRESIACAQLTLTFCERGSGEAFLPARRKRADTPTRTTRSPMAPAISASALSAGALGMAVVAALLAALGFRGRDEVLGVDLGTTFSSIAVRSGGALPRAHSGTLQASAPRVKIVRDPISGSASIPSVVALDPALPGGWAVGRAAEGALASAPERLVLDTKRVLGRAPDDPVVLIEARRHGGRLMEHPSAKRRAVTGRACGVGPGGNGRAPSFVRRAWEAVAVFLRGRDLLDDARARSAS
jgi:hypothetical protein